MFFHRRFTGIHCSKNRPNPHWTLPRRWLAGVLAAAGFALTVGSAEARSDDGPGAQVRIGHIEGQGVSQVLPVTPIELMPYYEFDQQLMFSDLRFVITNDGTFGGNIGFGYRFFEPESDRIYGASIWYDVDDAREVMFQQIGISLESYGTDFDVRGNVYIPVGPESRQDSLKLVQGSLGYVGQNLVYTQNRSWYTAMTGFDLEAGVPVPGSFAESIDLRVYGGGYYYSNDFHDIPGISGRVRANILPGLDVEVQVTHDSFFETRAYAGISWTFGPLHYSNFEASDTLGRLGEHVTRNYSVVATHQRDLERIIASNPTTKQPYRFAHVNSSALPGGTGGVADPFNSISAAQAIDPDIVFVHAGSVFNGVNAQVVLQPGDRILGDGSGIQHLVSVPELGTFALPNGPTSGASPRLENATGTAVTLASNSEFSGFSIINPTGRGIAGNGVSGFFMQGVTVQGSGSHGLELLNPTGRNEFRNLFVNDTVGSGIRLVGGTGTTIFSGTTHVSDADSAAVVLSGLSAGSQTSFDNLLVDNRSGRGLEIDSLSGTATFGGTTRINNEKNTDASAVDIRNSSGSVSFGHLIASNTRVNPGVNIQDNTGTTTIGTLDVNSTGGTAVRANKGGTLRINPAVNGVVNTTAGGTVTAINGTALDIEGTAMDVNLLAVNSSGAATGLRLVNDTGTFAIWGSGPDGSGGLIQGGTTGIFLKDLDTVGFRSMRIDGNGTGIHAEDVNLLIVQQTDVIKSTGFGLDLVDVQALNVVESLFQDNAGTNLRADFGEVLSYSYTLNNSFFLSPASDNILLSSSAGGTGSSLNLQVLQSEINNTLAGTTGMRVNWNGALSGTFDRNFIQGSGGTNTGLAIVNTGGALSNLALTNNHFVMTNGNGLGFSLNTAAAAQTAITNNLFELSGTGGTGIRATAVSPNFIITSNTIRDVSGGTTGILFDSLTGPGQVTINGNLIDLSSQTILLDRGIAFSGISNTIQLIGTQNNSIVGAAQDLIVPVGTTTGSILINGVPKP